MIIYKLGNDLDLDAVIALYQDSMLGERRPITDRGRMAAMIRNANVVVTAWDGRPRATIRTSASSTIRGHGR
jgi:hypothetical protein